MIISFELQPNADFEPQKSKNKVWNNPIAASEALHNHQSTKPLSHYVVIKITQRWWSTWKSRQIYESMSIQSWESQQVFAHFSH